MNLISRKKSKTPLQQGLGYFKLVLKGLVAQRMARKAYTGYTWTRRLPFLIAGAGIVAAIAFAVRKAQSRGGQDTGLEPSSASPSTAATAATSPPATTPSTPTPTGSPTAVSPAPTADGAPTVDAGETSDEDAESKS